MHGVICTYDCTVLRPAAFLFCSPRTWGCRPQHTTQRTRSVRCALLALVFGLPHTRHSVLFADLTNSVLSRIDIYSTQRPASSTDLDTAFRAICAGWHPEEQEGVRQHPHRGRRNRGRGDRCVLLVWSWRQRPRGQDFRPARACRVTNLAARKPAISRRATICGISMLTRACMTPFCHNSTSSFSTRYALLVWSTCCGM